MKASNQEIEKYAITGPSIRDAGLNGKIQGLSMDQRSGSVPPAINLLKNPGLDIGYSAITPLNKANFVAK